MNYKGIGHSISAAITILVLLTTLLCPFQAQALDAFDLAVKFWVLKELGIDFSEETQLDMQVSICETKANLESLGIDATQFTSYPFILSMLGMGKYDEASHSFIPLSNNVFAFDAECIDISEAYGKLLYEVSRISNGEIQIEDYRSDVDEATFEAGIGIQEVVFKLNGEPCHFTAHFYYDWLDCTIIDYVNSLLEGQNTEKRLLYMSDGAQGLVVFYNTVEWAIKFKNQTGYSLVTNTNQASQETW